MAVLTLGSLPCGCTRPHDPPRRVVLTGGPGAGKTAVLEMARRALCRHVAILPEAAGIVFGGGFPRHSTEPGRRAAQRAIFRVQQEVEALVDEERVVAIALCDRGTVDGLAYWPGTPQSYWDALGTTHERELGRYETVIHLETPPLANGYNQANALRIESAEEAAVIDARIADAWKAHPRCLVVPSAIEFVEKAEKALAFIQAELPPCCRAHSGVPRH